MPQYREKSARGQPFGVGLLTYPVLQAADILLYQADTVPVGEDQRQHLELTRDIAQRFNNRFGETFVVPEGTYPEFGAKVMDLQEPTSRMSTSAASDAGVLRVLDGPDVLRRKIRSAVTDSGREVLRRPDKPGITNLIELYAAASGETPEQIEARYDAQGYGPFKADVAEAVVALVEPIQARYEELRTDPEELRSILAHGAAKAHEVAAATLALAYERVGFVAP
jgi:tryptophanyl-tRNA synthetase